MVDSLSDRVGRVVAGSAHALIDKIENLAPDAMMEQALKEVDKVIAEVQHELGTVSANRHLVQQQHATQTTQHNNLSLQINTAINASRDDLARVAVARQLDIEAQLPVLEQSLVSLNDKETELKGYINALMAKRREMTEALNEFRKSRVAVTQSGGTGQVGSNKEQRLNQATTAFDKIYARQTGLSPAAAGATLQQVAQLKELEDMMHQTQIEERLARLKANSQS